MSFGMGVPPLKNVEVALLGQVALEEAIDHAYPQTRFEGPHIRLGELPYLLAVGARPSRHFFKEFDSGRRISSSRVRVSPDLCEQDLRNSEDLDRFPTRTELRSLVPGLQYGGHEAL
jgi:hypothetical protein